MNRKATLITFGMREYGKARDVPKEFTQIRLDFKGHSLFSSVQFSVTWMGQGMLLLLQHISCCHQAEELEVSTWIADANKLLVNSIYFWRKAPKKHSQSITKPYISEDTALLTLISVCFCFGHQQVSRSTAEGISTGCNSLLTSTPAT